MRVTPMPFWFLVLTNGAQQQKAFSAEACLSVFSLSPGTSGAVASVLASSKWLLLDCFVPVSSGAALSACSSSSLPSTWAYCPCPSGMAPRAQS